ncbi:MAG: molybdenum cofactor guanylyltransferase [Acidobacteriota bacterium]
MDSTAGFVLTGGRNSRMGHDKALLPIEGSLLVERTAERVRAAAGSVTLIGAPGRYARLGLPVLQDLTDGCGPIAGLHTALETTRADWNLVVACDMPGITAGFLSDLLSAAKQLGCACMAPQTDSGLHPLCAVYHRRAGDAVEFAIQHKRFKMHDLLKSLGALPWPVADASLLENVNTPLEWGTR